MYAIKCWYLMDAQSIVLFSGHTKQTAIHSHYTISTQRDTVMRYTASMMNRMMFESLQMAIVGNIAVNKLA